ncbi:MAG: NUMOD4 domain-containing protein [Smithellaceae bacterium]
MNKISRGSKEEVWKQISGYKGLYDVSNLGRVRSYYNRGRLVNSSSLNSVPKVLKPLINTSGQPKVHLVKDCCKTVKSVAKLVAAAFLEQPEDESWVVSCRDGNWLNPAAGNLRYCSKSTATRHAGKKSVRGSRYGGCLNREKAKKIREKYGTGEGIEGDNRKRSITYESLADEYGVTPPAICQLINRVTYK